LKEGKLLSEYFIDHTLALKAKRDIYGYFEDFYRAFVDFLGKCTGFLKDHELKRGEGNTNW
jgi:hypothetical protein